MLNLPQKLVTFVVMLSLSISAGCETTTDEMPYTTMDLAQPVEILHSVVGGHPSLDTPGLTLISSRAQLDALTADDLIGRPVNFDNEAVVLATLGEMPSSGYWINITEVFQEGDVLQVYGHANRPAEDAMAGQVLTYPYCAIVVQRTGASMAADQIESVEGQEPPM